MYYSKKKESVEMSYQDDKRELLKLKQGLIEESETIQEEKRETVKLHGWKRVSNFFYHYKWHVVAAAFFIAVAGFFIYDLVKKEHGDIRVLVIVKDNDLAKQTNYKTKDFELAFEKYCPDYDDSGYVHVDTYNIDLSENIDSNYMLASVTKLTGEINFGEAQMYIMDTPALESIITDGDTSGFVDLEELYPENPQIDGVFYKLKDSDFAYMANYVEACPEDLFIVIRKTTDATANKERAEAAQKKALEVFDNIINGTMSGWEDDDGRVYGIYDEGETELKPML